MTTINVQSHGISADLIAFGEAEGTGTRWIDLGPVTLYVDRENGVEQMVALIAAAEKALTSLGATRGTVRDHLGLAGSKLTVAPVAR